MTKPKQLGIWFKHIKRSVEANILLVIVRKAHCLPRALA